METPKLYTPINSNYISEKYIKTNYPEFYCYLLETYECIENFQEKLYWYHNKLSCIPTCLCGNNLKFNGFNNGYSEFCSRACAGKYSREKISQSHIKNWKENKTERLKKVSKTKEINHGDPNYNNRSKAYKTKLEKFGDGTYNNRGKFKETWSKKSNEELDEIIQKIRKTKGKEYLQPFFDNIISVKYNQPGKYKTIYTCNDNGNIYEIPARIYWVRVHDNTILNTNILPVGAISISSGELYVRNYLDKLGIEYVHNDRDILNGKELDLYIPSKQIAIEVNGVYWHRGQNKHKRYHTEKYKKCRENGIQLLSVWEDWIKSKPEIVCSIISSKLGIYNERIFARKCTAREIDSCSNFLNQHHIQGNCPSKVKIGLFYNDELVSVMTFGQRKNGLVGKIENDNDWELLRFCNKNRTQVVGGASKLLQYFITHYKPSSIISFSSNDISNGNLYKKLGFEYICENLSYWYIKDHKRYHRSNFTKKKLVKEGFDPNLTETEIMLERGFFQIYDSGQTKWILKT